MCLMTGDKPSSSPWLAGARGLSELSWPKIGALLNGAMAGAPTKGTHTVGSWQRSAPLPHSSANPHDESELIATVCENLAKLQQPHRQLQYSLIHLLELACDLV